MSSLRVMEAAALMRGFAERTGLAGGEPPRRYLWTDAFAVCNFLGLARATGAAETVEHALRLIDEVHHVLGRHRDDDVRSGWLSGLPEDEGEAQPTRGGLRIGKALPERAPDEALDERLEWERDGQYFHYLTKWMHALDQAARATGEATYNAWARELAAAACAGFAHSGTGAAPARLHWKMSVDLSRPLVDSMGQHDALDGYLCCVQLTASAALLAEREAGPDLAPETRALAAMIEPAQLASADPLGIGGLLIDAARLEQLRREHAPLSEDLLEALLAAARAGLDHYVKAGDYGGPARQRLAFRELGLALGLQALALMDAIAEQGPPAAAGRATVRELRRALLRHAALGTQLEDFWRQPAHQAGASWTAHRDINEVMLATCLAPEGFLVLQRPG